MSLEIPNLTWLKKKKFLKEISQYNLIREGKGF